MGKKIVAVVALVGSLVAIIILVFAFAPWRSSPEERRDADDLDFNLFFQGLESSERKGPEELAQLRPAAPRVEPASGDHGREIGEVAAAVKEVGKKVVQEAQARRREHQFMLAVGERNTTRVLAGQSFIQQRLDGIETQTRVQNFFRDQSLGEVRGQVEILLRDLRSAQTPP